MIQLNLTIPINLQFVLLQMQQLNHSNSQSNKIKSTEEPQYKEKYYKIQNIVEGLNQKLSDLFEKKQNQQINQYTNQMIKIKQQLNELKANTNQDELKKKYYKKKDQLKLQRDKHLQISILFCNKCEIFKQKLSKTITEARDLQNQIKFLTTQIKQANSQNQVYKYVITKYNYNDIVNSKKYIESIAKSIDGQKKNQVSEDSQYLIASSKMKKDKNIITQKTLMRRNQSYNNNNYQIKRKGKLDLKLKAILQKNSLNQTQFEKMFMHSVLKIKQKKKQKKKQDKRYGKSSPKSKLQEYDRKIHDSELNDFDKKNIIQHFLSKEQVKKYLYELIFKDIEDLEKDKKKGNRLQIFEKKFI